MDDSSCHLILWTPSPHYTSFTDWEVHGKKVSGYLSTYELSTWKHVTIARRKALCTTQSTLARWRGLLCLWGGGAKASGVQSSACCMLKSNQFNQKCFLELQPYDACCHYCPLIHMEKLRMFWCCSVARYTSHQNPKWRWSICSTHPVLLHLICWLVHGNLLCEWWAFLVTSCARMMTCLLMHSGSTGNELRPFLVPSLFSAGQTYFWWPHASCNNYSCSLQICWYTCNT